MRNPRNILLHELIGLECKVIGSKNKNHLGIKGRIIDETKNLIILETKKGIKKISKKGAIFRLKLENGIVEILGNDILARPEDRIKRRIKEW
ncbi:MAG: ribonuclease P protein subunit [Candidatus Aenigmarchaeota archaeon]|nr:ribonuclease P protein subunit [Candidatus Aenigmarchaeota archaeon]